MKLQVARLTLFALIVIASLTTPHLAAAQSELQLGEQRIEIFPAEENNQSPIQLGPDGAPLFYDLIIIIIILAVFAVIGIVAVIWWIRKIIPKRKTTLDILKNRLAKGEITKEEYDELKKEFES